MGFVSYAGNSFAISRKFNHKRRKSDIFSFSQLKGYEKHILLSDFLYNHRVRKSQNQV